MGEDQEHGGSGGMSGEYSVKTVFHQVSMSEWILVISYEEIWSTLSWGAASSCQQCSEQTPEKSPIIRELRTLGRHMDQHFLIA